MINNIKILIILMINIDGNSTVKNIFILGHMTMTSIFTGEQNRRFLVFKKIDYCQCHSFKKM